MNILTMPDESTCDGHRKYLRFLRQFLSRNTPRNQNKKRGSLPLQKNFLNISYSIKLIKPPQKPQASCWYRQSEHRQTLPISQPSCR